MLPVVAAILLVPAWSLHFWQGWVYLVAVVGFWVVLLSWLVKADPQLMERRLAVREKEPAQKLFQKLWTAICIPAFIVPGLDFRFGWSRRWLSPVPGWAWLAADAVALAGSCLIFWTLMVNSYAGRVIQVEPGQKLITTGPYAIVRHPFYAGMIIWALATPFALGSYLAIPLYLLLIPVIIYRLIHEEQTLLRELPGYAEYSSATRFRLLKGVW